MTNSGWGGPGDGSPPQGQNGQPGQGGAWQQQPQGGQQPGQGWQHGQGSQQPVPGGQPSQGGQWQQPPAWQQSPGQHSGAQPPQGPGFPQGPGSPQGPDGFGEPPQRKRPWALLAVAATCVVAMVLVIGGGITFLALNRGGEDPVASDTATSEASDPEDSTEPDDSETSPTVEPSEYSEFKVLGLGEFPEEATTDELLGVMQDNPLTQGNLPDVGECELPATPVKPSTEELQAVLDASAACLNQVWSVASSDRGLPWVAPKVVVYTWPDVPSSSSCERESFYEDSPRMCNLDSTIYWPEGYGLALDFEDEKNVPGAYLWDLAYSYSFATSWNSTLAFYQGELSKQYKDSNPEAHADAWRRNSLQWVCWASAATMQVPKAAQPSADLREALASPDAWNAGEPPEDIKPENRAHWIEVGFGSGGDLAQCNTWTAEVDTVS